MRRLFALCGASLALVALAGEAHATWPNDPGVNVRIAPTASAQSFLWSTEDGSGGAFFVWNESANVRAQHLTAQGLPAPGWPAAGLTICAAPGEQYPSGITADGAGGFIAAWDDYRGGSESDVYAQRVNAAGVVQWTANGVLVCGATNYQFSAHLCSDRVGGAILVWDDWRALGTNGFDVYAQRVSASGVVQWAANGVPVSVGPGNQTEPALVNDGTVGGCYIVFRQLATGQHVYALRLDAFGVERPGWTANGSPVSTVGGSLSPAIASDEAFGAYVVWSDSRSGNSEIYVAHLVASGPIAPGWVANGLPITSQLLDQTLPQVIADGIGGAIVAWNDPRDGNTDLYAQRIWPTGGTQWTPNGVALTRAPGTQSAFKLVSDGVGGALAAWRDQRASSPTMMYAQRVTGAGAIATGFAADGVAVSTAHNVQDLALVSDGAGGVIVGWQDNGAAIQCYAQRVDRWGYLGAQPRIRSVRDVPNDQGGLVKLSWDRSPADAYPGLVVASYTIYRSVPPQTALAGRDARSASASRATRTRIALPLAGAVTYWEELATVAAAQLEGYSVLAETAQDSSNAGAPRTQFMVRAADASGTRSWFSDPDSAYSVDNLPPAAPAPFTGAYSAGSTHLHWQPNSEVDVAYYRLYRGGDASFVPAPGNMIAMSADTGWVDPGPAHFHYKLTAVDVHGNESAPTLLAPSARLDAPPGAPLELALASPSPNPMRGATTCRFTLPAAGRARVTVHDVAGRLVRVLAEGAHAAGHHAVTWDGADEHGTRAPRGLYFVRLQAEGEQRVRRVVRMAP